MRRAHFVHVPYLTRSCALIVSLQVRVDNTIWSKSNAKNSQSLSWRMDVARNPHPRSDHHLAFRGPIPTLDTDRRQEQ